jgi:gliding motility-associated-like protein
MKKYILLLIVLGFISLAGRAQTPDANGILYVKKGSSGTGASWGNALGEVADALRAATLLNATTPGTVKQIWVTGGTYLPKYPANAVTTGTATNTNRNNAFVLLKDVQLYGGFAGTETDTASRDLTLTANASILSGNIGSTGIETDNTYHVVVAAGTAGTAAINGFTITAGFSDQSAGTIMVNSTTVSQANGAGISIASASPIIANIIITGNKTLYSYGGGIHCTGTSGTAISPVFKNITCTYNQASIGGGISTVYANSVFTDVVVSNNSATGSSGGGIYTTSSSPTLTNVSCNANMSAVYGGGGFFSGIGTSIIINNCSFTNNKAINSGGGLAGQSGSSITISNSVILNNTALNIGGGLQTQSSSSINLNGVTISGNESTNFGGGFYLGGASNVFKNVIITGNNCTSASGSGGGGYIYTGNTVLINTTIAGNKAPTSGGLYNAGTTNTINNSIIYGNSSGVSTTSGIKYSLVQNVTPDPSNYIIATSPGYVNDPGYATAPFTTGNYSLQGGSPAIGAGSNALYTGLTPATKDLAGTPRVSGDSIDLGAYEYDATVRPDVNGILYVKKGSTGTGDSWSNALGEVADALKTATLLNAATAGTVKQIWVAGGTYLPRYPADAVTTGTVTNTDRNNAFVLVKDVQLYGGFAGTETDTASRDLTLTANASILSGDIGTAGIATDNAYHVVIAAGAVGTAAIDGFTVTGGYAANTGSASITVNSTTILQAYGAGINITEASPVIENMTITRNKAPNGWGGGVYSKGTASAIISPVFKNVTISYNNSTTGGGMANSYANTVFRNVVFSKDSVASGNGGGMYSSNCSTELTNVSFNENFSPSNGGGLYYNNSPSAVLNNCSFIGNKGISGGLTCNLSAVTITNSVFLSNTGTSNGGAIYLRNSTGTCDFNHITIHGNISDVQGGGIYSSNSTALFTDVAISGNQAKSFGGGFISLNSSCTIKDAIITGNICTDPSGSGGGGYISAGNVVLTNTTIAGNKAASGGGLYDNSGTATVTNNSIIYGNSSGINSTNGMTYSLVQDVTPDASNHIITANPLFVNDPGYTNAPFITGDYSLQAGSPAIGAGSNVLYTGLTAATKDLAGNARLSGDSIDLGPYESAAPAPDINGILYVKKGSTGTGNSWNNALGEVAWALQTAALLNASTAGTVKQIWVAGGTYLPKYPADAVTTGTATNTDRNNAFVLVKDVQLYGGFAGTETDTAGRDLTLTANASILSGDIGTPGVATDNAYHVVIAAGAVGTASINGFIVTAGYSENTGNTSIPVNSTTVLQANGAGINITSASPVIANLTITGNKAVTGQGGGVYCSGTAGALISPVFKNITCTSNAAAAGGGIFNSYANTVLTDVILSKDSSAGHGGGMYNSRSSTQLTNVYFNENLAVGAGGGLYHYSTSAAVMNNCSFISNKAATAGGILCNANSSITMTNSVIRSNTATGDVGGIYIANNSSSNLKHVIISDNSAGTLAGGAYFTLATSAFTEVVISGNQSTGNGAGFYSTASSPVFKNVLITGNVSTGPSGNGGGGYISGGNVVLTNTTIAGNKASTGGGLFNVGTTATVNNSIIYGNSPGASSTSGMTYCLVQDVTPDAANHIIAADPLFVNDPGYMNAPFTTGDYSLQNGSPAIGAGSNALFSGLTAATQDLAGNPRLSLDSIDLGTYEYVGQTQTIYPKGDTAVTYGNVDFEPGVTASSGFTVSYASSDNTIAAPYQDAADGNKWKIAVKAAGTVNITASQAGNASYEAATDVVFQLTIHKAALAVTARDTTKVYDGITWSGGHGVTYSGFVNSEDSAAVLTGTLSYSGSSQSAKEVNTYIVTPEGLAAANYTITYNDGTLTISKAALTVTAKDATKTYDGIAYSNGNGVTYSGFVNSEDSAAALTGSLVYSGSSQGAKEVNTYVITPGGLTATNYAITYTNGTLTIGKAALTITANNAAKTYNGIPYSNGNGVTYSGFVNGEDSATALTGILAYSGTSQGAKEVNTYAITPGGLAAVNYEITYTNGTLTISKALLTIKANDAMRCYGTANPAFTVTYSGWVNNETTAVLSTLPTAGTIATPSSAAGNYNIVPAGATADNYTFTYLNGNLTVQALPVSMLSATQGTILCGTGAAIPLSASGNYTFEWKHDNVVVPGAVTGLLTASSTGTYTVTATDNNSCVAPATNSITVTQLLAPKPAFSFNTYCTSQPVTFINGSDITGSGTVNYSWTAGNGQTSTSASPQFTYSSAGSYNVALTATVQGCPLLATTVEHNISIEAPIPGVQLNAVYTSAGAPIPLQARNYSNAAYTWLPATGLSTTSVYNPATTLDRDQAYQVQMTFPSGCITTDTLQVFVMVNNDILVANVFTPNGDGQNDLLTVNLRGVSKLNYFRVFNRSGKKIFESNDPAQGWDGRFNGVLQPLATYVWTAEGIDRNGRTIHRQGSTTLLR